MPRPQLSRLCPALGALSWPNSPTAVYACWKQVPWRWGFGLGGGGAGVLLCPSQFIAHIGLERPRFVSPKPQTSPAAQRLVQGDRNVVVVPPQLSTSSLTATAVRCGAHS